MFILMQKYSEKEVVMERKYLSVKDAAQLSGLSRWYLYKLTAKKNLPMLKIGNRCLFPVDEFRGWLEKHRIEKKEDKND